MSDPTYAYLDAYGWVIQYSHEPLYLYVNTDAGVPEQVPYPVTQIDGLTTDPLPDGFVVKPWLRKIDGVYTDMLPTAGDKPSRSATLERVNDALLWHENIPLSDVVSQARDHIDAAADNARRQVLSYRETKDLEYERAEKVARPYRDAGYPDPVPEAVQSWADAKKWTNGGVPWTGQRAADDILAQADQYDGLLDQIRRLRLDAMEHCKALGLDPNGTPGQVDAVEDKFYADLATLMSTLPSGG